MINWYSIVANSFWLLGLAIILAGLSYYYWLAAQTGRSFGEILGTPSFQRVIVIGALLVGIGLALTAGSLWQVLPAAALIVVSVIALVTSFRARSNTPPTQ